MATDSQTTEAAITGCHHVAICAHDIDEARRFYGEVIGLVELERPPEIADRFRSAWFQLGPSELHVVENGDFEAMNSPLGPHLAVVTSDFEAVTNGIKDRGGQFVFGPGAGPDGTILAVIKDPTGNTLEITTAAQRS